MHVSAVLRAALFYFLKKVILPVIIICLVVLLSYLLNDFRWLISRNNLFWIGTTRLNPQAFSNRLVAVGIAIALIGGLVVYDALKKWVGIRLSEEQEYAGADLSIHKISAHPE